MKIAVLGDIHANWKTLNFFIKHSNPNMILSCGDFGYWPGHDAYDLNIIKNKNCKIHFCDGNHENHEKLQKLKDTELQVRPNIFYQPRGSTLKLPDGRTILFMGGANSIDKHLRTPGHNWFPEENISIKDMQNLPNEKIDIVISHTCPQGVEFIHLKSDWSYRLAHDLKKKDTNRSNLLEILKIYQPTLWYFGHWHWSEDGFIDNCHWFALDEINGSGWVKWIELQKD